MNHIFEITYFSAGVKLEGGKSLFNIRLLCPCLTWPISAKIKISESLFQLYYKKLNRYTQLHICSTVSSKEKDTHIQEEITYYLDIIAQHFSYRASYSACGFIHAQGVSGQDIYRPETFIGPRRRYEPWPDTPGAY